MYKCELCNYATDDKSNLGHHNKSKKHISKTEKNKIDDEINLQKQAKEIEELKQKIHDIEKEKAKLEVEAKIYKEFAEKGTNANNMTNSNNLTNSKNTTNSNNNVNNGIIINNNLNYVNKHFKDAPPLKKITDYKLNGLDMNDDANLDKLIDDIIYFHKNKSLHKVIGDHIIKLYKKDDLKEQSFHTTDVSRRKYLVKLEQKLGRIYDESDDSDSDSESDDDTDTDNNKKNKTKNKKKSEWINDSGGVKIGYLIFDPITKKVIKIIKKKFRQYNDELKNDSKKGPSLDDIRKFETITDISKVIDNDKLKKNINNYIAPHFVLDKE